MSHDQVINPLFELDMIANDGLELTRCSADSKIDLYYKKRVTNRNNGIYWHKQATLSGTKMPVTKKIKQIKSNITDGYEAIHSIPCIATKLKSGAIR